MNWFQRLMHKHFGWHYVLVTWGFGHRSVLRVRYMPTGDVYYMLHGQVNMMDTNKKSWKPLTWKDGDVMRSLK